MGNGIAHLFAQYGFDVRLVDVDDQRLASSRATIEKNLDRLVKKEMIKESHKIDTLKRIGTTLSIDDCGDVDLAVEAVSETFEIKQSVFSKLDEVCQGHVILATNTSSISITKIAAVTRRPQNVIGMHFMNPVPVMKLVEIIRGLATSQETYDSVRSLAETVQKVPVEVQDYPGFVSNRLLMPMINEAIYCLMEGVAEAQAIDTVMKLGMSHPMGPLTLADFIGLDVCLAIMNVLHEGLGDSKYRPCPLLKKMVAAGHLGVKSGRGFFDHSAG